MLGPAVGKWFSNLKQVSTFISDKALMRLCIQQISNSMTYIYYNSNDFRDSVPILSALEYNTWFKSLRASNVKLSHEAMDRFLHVVRKSLTIEELHLDNIGAKT
jgi:hypothetical protein